MPILGSTNPKTIAQAIAELQAADNLGPNPADSQIITALPGLLTKIADTLAQDFPRVIEITKTYAEQNNVGQQFSYLPGDLREISFGMLEYDLVILANILHSEGERIKAETIQILAKIHSQAEQEIAAAGKAARQELKAHSINLAVQLAEAKVRSRLTPQSQDGLVNSFMSDLGATRPVVN